MKNDTRNGLRSLRQATIQVTEVQSAKGLAEKPDEQSISQMRFGRDDFVNRGPPQLCVSLFAVTSGLWLYCIRALPLRKAFVVDYIPTEAAE